VFCSCHTRVERTEEVVESSHVLVGKCIQTYIHTYIHTDTDIHAYIHTYLHTQTYEHAYIRTEEVVESSHVLVGDAMLRGDVGENLLGHRHHLCNNSVTTV
jgi:hypothetical protein